MPKTLPPITPKQQEILTLLYRYRFLNRTQIQQLLNHKDKRRILSWLKDLREKEYVDWHYDPNDFVAKTKPGIYFLALNGIRYLRQAGTFPTEQLRKRYKETSRKQSYIEKCLLVADCCLSLKSNSVRGVKYSHLVESDYIDPESDYNFLDELHPDIFFTKQDGDTAKTYFLELFDINTPRYAVKKRLSEYAEYIIDEEWRDYMQIDEPPIMLLAFESTAELLYSKRRILTLLDGDAEETSSSFRFSTYDKINQQGVDGVIWEDS